MADTGRRDSKKAKKPGLLYLSLKSTFELLDASEVVEIAEATLHAHDRGEIVWSTPRIIGLQAPQMKARFRAKLCALPNLDAVGFRVTSFIPGDENYDGGPTRMVLVTDPDSGEFRAIVDERWCFALRTGAGAALGIKYLHGVDTTEVGLVGAGQMARGTIVMLKAALPKLRRVVVTSRRPESRERVARELSAELGIEIAPLASAEELLATVDAVVVSTSTKTPIIEERWLRPGCTIYSLGANQELDTPSYTRVDKFIADDWGQVQLKHDIVELMARKEFSEADVYGDLAEILGGRKPGRERSEERILIRSEGLVTMDVALAQHLYERALERGLGQALEI